MVFDNPTFNRRQKAKPSVDKNAGGARWLNGRPLPQQDPHNRYNLRNRKAGSQLDTDLPNRHGPGFQRRTNLVPQSRVQRHITKTAKHDDSFTDAPEDAGPGSYPDDTEMTEPVEGDDNESIPNAFETLLEMETSKPGDITAHMQEFVEERRRLARLYGLNLQQSDEEAKKEYLTLRLEGKEKASQRSQKSQETLIIRTKKEGEKLT